MQSFAMVVAGYPGRAVTVHRRIVRRGCARSSARPPRALGEALSLDDAQRDPRDRDSRRDKESTVHTAIGKERGYLIHVAEFISGRYIVRSGSMGFVYGYIVGNGSKRFGCITPDALQVSTGAISGTSNVAKSCMIN